MSDDLGGGNDMVLSAQSPDLPPRRVEWSPTDAIAYGWIYLRITGEEPLPIPE